MAPADKEIDPLLTYTLLILAVTITYAGWLAIKTIEKESSRMLSAILLDL